MAYYKLSNIADFQQAHEQWLVSHREMYPNDLITCKYCEPLQVGSFWFIPATDVTASWNIGELVNDIHEWHDPNSSIQIVFDKGKLLDLIFNHTDFIGYKDFAIIEEQFAYIYLNFLLPEHEEIIKKYNAIINIKS